MMTLNVVGKQHMGPLAKVLVFTIDKLLTGLGHSAVFRLLRDE